MFKRKGHWRSRIWKQTLPQPPTYFLNKSPSTPLPTSPVLAEPRKGQYWCLWVWRHARDTEEIAPALEYKATHAISLCQASILTWPLKHISCGLRLASFLAQFPKDEVLGLPWWRSGWESACQCRGHGFNPWSTKIPHATEQLSPCTTTIELAL